MIEELINSNCIKIGNFKLKNGEISKYYFDMKNIISKPSLLRKIGDELYKLLGDFDIICGIPYGALPIATYISVTYDKPLIYIRDKPKAYGTGKLIEGTYKESDKCVIIDDVITTGYSLQESINILKDKVDIVNVAVVMNRQQGYKCSLPVKSLLYKNDVVKYRLKKIGEEKKSRLCFSADIEDPIKILEMLNKIGKQIVVCKIHFDIINFQVGETPTPPSGETRLAIPPSGETHYNERDFINALIKCSIEHNFLIMEDRKFVDISSIVEKQFLKFCNWIDLVTVHGTVSSEVVSKLCGVLLVANMSNNNFDLTSKTIELANNNLNNMIGFITQFRINCKEDLICMTPGISNKITRINDQNYKTKESVDTDYIIVGRALYNSENIEKDVLKFI